MVGIHFSEICNKLSVLLVLDYLVIHLTFQKMFLFLWKFSSYFRRQDTYDRPELPGLIVGHVSSFIQVHITHYPGPCMKGNPFENTS